ncbi:MAG: 30S ribosomal protein S12 methylthiotransferase RimO [Planctomycetota bacterium]|jgi:ribosomal protein S12 methylthiotransferase
MNQDETKVAFVSLGCAKNLVDSEKMLGQLAEAGCSLIADEDAADVVVINTCGFLDASRIEADAVIGEAIERKNSGLLKRVVVAGCLVQRDGADMVDRIPGIDALVGVNNRDDIVDAVLGESAPGRAQPDVYLSDYHAFTQLDTARLRLTPRHYAYLRISEGCDQKCTFCTIPAIRGRMHCKPPSIVLAEARELISDGAIELHLIGQDTTSYGLGDNPFDADLGGLLTQLNALDGIHWIRLMYVYPSVMSDAIIDAIAQSPNVCKYIDIPLQHISDPVLKGMYRRIDRAATETLLQKIRDRIPGVTIRTTMIAGFPGETDEHFQELCDFVEDFKFDALGVFTYSLEPDTPAGRMKNQVPENIKQQRFDELMRVQQAVAFDLAERRVGQEYDVLIDGFDETGRLVGRHEGQAPTVDSVTFVDESDARPGDIVRVRITERDGYDLVGEPTRRPLPVIG